MYKYFTLRIWSLLQKCQWPRGKILGGSNGINYLMYVRGDARDYDHWEKLGNPGWGFKDVFPYFLKSEKQNGKYKNSSYHNSKGWLEVSDNKYLNPMLDAYEKMAERNNLTCKDINDGNVEGFDFTQFNIDEEGRRADTFSTILKPAEKIRDNLVVLKNAQVTRILFNDKKIAKGRNFTRFTTVNVFTYL